MSHAPHIAQRIVAPAAMALAAVTAAMTVTVAAHAGINGEQCKAVVLPYLDRLGVDAGAVESIGIAPIVGNPSFGTYREYQAWISFASCPGSLVLRMTTDCRVKDSFTRGNCTFPSVSHF